MAKVIQKGRAVNSNSSETILYYKAKNGITSGGVVFFVSKKTITIMSISLRYSSCISCFSRVA